MGAFIHPACRNGERGVALLTALLLMLAVLMASVATARTAINGARAAGHERDRMLALHAAMAALADAEHDIEGGIDPGSARAAALANATPAAFATGCRGGAPYDGLCERVADAGGIFAALADDHGPAVALGTFTGVLIPAGEGALPARAPRYLIERMPSAAGTLLYRVSALGFGSVATTQVALQAYYRKLLAGTPPAGGGAPGSVPQPGTEPARPAPRQGQEPEAGPHAPPEPPSSALPGQPGGPGIRVGWREVGNWHEAVASAGAQARTED